MNVKVMIPVTLGGYTGQREQWEESIREYEVSFVEGDGNHRLVNLDLQLPITRRISFDLDELEDAVYFLSEHQKKALAEDGPEEPELQSS